MGSQEDGKALSASNTVRWNASCTVGFPLQSLSHVEVMGEGVDRLMGTCTERTVG